MVRAEIDRSEAEAEHLALTSWILPSRKNIGELVETKKVIFKVLK